MELRSYYSNLTDDKNVYICSRSVIDPKTIGSNRLILLLKLNPTTLKIAIIGYGKMGKAIAQILENEGHEISFKIDSSNLSELDKMNNQNVDVAIEFTHPEAAYDNLKLCITKGISVITGTTGWLDKLEEIKLLATSHQVGFLYASNFSLGVNLFFKINTQVAAWMSKHPEYACHIQEIHHTAKKDAPSGTAISLAQQIIGTSTQYQNWALHQKNDQKSADHILPIQAIREDPAPGTHTIQYDGVHDSITLTHTAHSRQGFALGAAAAANWIFGKKGIFTMQDVLEL